MNTPASLPVTVDVPGDDGSLRRVRVGFAVSTGDGYALHLGDLCVDGVPVSVAQALKATLTARGPRPAGGAGASLDELENLAVRARKVLADPKKAKWHEGERNLLAAIEAELARKRAEQERRSA